jgi:hypothetical protein
MAWALQAWPNLSMPPYVVFLPNHPSLVTWKLVSPQPHWSMPTAMLTAASAAISSDNEPACCLAMSAE